MFNTEVTVIINIWKRPYLEEQILSLKEQSILPKNIWIVHCGDHISIKKCLSKYTDLNYIHSTLDLKYFFRFNVALHSSTKYTWVIDDDVIPSSIWIEKCINAIEKYNSIVCSNGRIIPKGDFTPEKFKDADHFKKYFIGDPRPGNFYNQYQEDTYVDFACSSFFFKTEWLRYFWQIPPHTFETGEDMHLSATCKILGGIKTMVLKQLSNDDSGNKRALYSYDEHASWKNKDFIFKRSGVLHYLINDKNWELLLWS